MANRIDFNVGFKADTSGLEKAKQSLAEFKQLTTGQYMNIRPELDMSSAQAELTQIKTSISELEGAYTRAFNQELGTVNIKQFNTELAKSDRSLDEIYSDMAKLGSQGISAFRNMASSVLSANQQLTQTKSLLSQAGESLIKTGKWFVSSSVINRLAGSINESVGYVKALDSSLNDIRIVTGASADEMDRFAVKANKAAKSLGAATTDYTNAALIYRQQGLGEAETDVRTQATLKVANVTGQDTAAVSEELTALWNGYQVATEDTESAVDKLSAVAAMSASSLEELATGMSKVASAANSMGVTEDQLVATMSAIISVTRQAPEAVGTALKTIYARLGDLKLGGSDEDGVGLGQVSGQLHDLGIEVLDETGEMRDMGIVMEEVAQKWQGWTKAQKDAAAVAMAGKRQYNNLIALFDNWNLYTDALDASTNSLGTLQNQQDIYMESAQAHLETMKASFEGVYDSLLDGDSIKAFADLMGSVASITEHFIDSIGGGTGTFLLLSSVITKLFNQQITAEIMKMSSGFKGMSQSAEVFSQKVQFKDSLAGIRNLDSGTRSIVDMFEEATSKGVQLGEEQQKELGLLTELTSKYAAQKAEIDEQIESEKEKLQIMENERTVAEALIKLRTGKNFKFDNYKGQGAGGTNRVSRDINDIFNTQNEKRDVSALNNVNTKYADSSNAIANIKAGKNGAVVSSNGQKEFQRYQKAIQQFVNDNQITPTDGQQSLLSIKPEDIQSLEDFKAKFKELVELRNEFLNNAEATNSFVEGLQEVNSTVQAIQEALANMNNQPFEGTEEEVQQIQQQYDELIAKVKEFIEAHQGKGLDSVFAEYEEQMKKAENEIEQVQQANSKGWDSEGVQKFADAVMGLADTFDNLENDLTITKEETETMVNEFNQLDEAQQKLKGLENESQRLNIQLESVGDRFKNFVGNLDLQQKVQGMVDFTQGLSSFAMGISSLSSINDTLKDDTLTLWEKFLQVSMSLGMGFPMLISGIQKLGTSFMGLIGPLALNIASQTTLNTVDAEGNVISIATVIRNAIESGSYLELAAAIWAAVAAKAALLGLSGGAAVVAIAATVAVVAALAGGLIYLAKNTKTAEDRLKDLRQQANLTGDTLRQISSDYDDLQNKLSNYEEAKKGLSKLTEGTDEWKDAVKDLNGQVTELIDKYPELINAVKLENGVMTLDETKYDNFLKEQQSSLINAQSFDTGATIQANKQQAQNSIQEKIVDSSLWGPIQAASEYLAKIGDASESWRFSEDGSLAAKKSEDGIITLDDNNAFVSAMREQGIADESIAQMIMGVDADGEELASKMGELTSAIIDLNNSMQIENSLDLNNRIENSKHAKDFEESENKDEIIELMNADIPQFEDMFKDDLYKKAATNETKVRDQYAQMLGKEDWAKFIEENPDQADLDINTIVEAIATAMAQQRVVNNYDTYAEKAEEEKKKEKEEKKKKNEVVKSKEELLEKDDNDNSIISNAATAADNLAKNSEYLTPQTIGNNSDYVALKENLNEIVKTYPSLESLSKKALNTSLAGTQEQIDAYEQLAVNMKLLQALEDGEAITQQKATELGITSLEQLDRARQESIISEEQYKAAEKGVAEAEAARYGMSAETLETYTKAMEEKIDKESEGTKTEKELEKEGKRLALANAKLGKSLKDIAAKWDDYSEALDSSKDGTQEQAEAIGEIQKSLAEGMDVDKDVFSPDFIKTNKDTIQKASSGDEDAMNDLWSAAGDEYLKKIVFTADTQDAEDKITKLGTAADEVKDFEVGASLDDTKFVDTLNEMLANGEMTAEEVEGYLNSIGFDPDITYEDATMEATMDIKASGLHGADSKTIEQMTAAMAKTTVKVPRINASGTIKKSGGLGGGGKKSGGGGGGGGSQGSAGKNLDKFEDEIDIYHKVETQINKITTALQGLESQQEKMSGDKLLKNLQEQIKSNQELIQQENAKLKIQQQEQKTVQTQLKGMGAGVKLNKDGSIKNYDNVLGKQQSKINKAIDEYNRRYGEGHNLSEDEQKAAEKEQEKIDTLKENYEKLKELLNKNDDLVNSIKETQNAIQEAYDKVIQKKIESFETSIEIRLDLTNTKRELNEFIAEITKDFNNVSKNLTVGKGIVANAAAAGENGTTYMKDYETNLAAYKKAKAAYDLIQSGTKKNPKTDKTYGDNAAAALEDMKKYYDGSKEALQGIYDEYENIKQAFSDMISEIQDGYSELNDQIDAVNSTLETQRNLIQLLQGEDSYAEMAKTYEAQAKNNVVAVKARRKEYEALSKEAESIRKKFGEASDEYKEAAAAVRDAKNELNSTLESSVELVVEKYQNAVNLAMQTTIKALTGEDIIEVLTEKWEKYTYEQETWLDKLSAKYQELDYTSNYQNALDNSNTERAKKSLNELYNIDLARLQVMEEQGKLTQNEVDYANLRLQLRLKEIALEEAQNNKSKMRLKRDSQGNYSYVYTADEKNIEKATKDYRKAAKDLYDRLKTDKQANEETYLSTLQDYQDKMIEAAQNSKYWKFDEKTGLYGWTKDGLEYLDTIDAEYREKLNKIVDTEKSVVPQLKDAAAEYAISMNEITRSAYNAFTDEEKEAWYKDYIGKNLDNPINQLLNSFMGDTNKIEDTLKQFKKESTSQLATLGKDVKELNDTANTIDVTNPTSGVAELKKETDKLSTSVDTFSESCKNSMEALDGVYNKLKEFTTYVTGKDFKSAIETLQGMNNAITKEDEKNADANEKASEAKITKEEIAKFQQSDNEVEIDDMPTMTKTVQGYSDSGMKNKNKKAKKGSKYKVIDIETKNKKVVKAYLEGVGWIKNPKKYFKKGTFDTGGYTGDWKDGSGKLAFLHSKELVLNKEDTKNVLAAVEAVRALQAVQSSALDRINSRSIIGSTFRGGRNDSPQEIQQNVHIDATFPGVKDAREIEQALNNLVNVASQHAWKK